MVSQLGPAHLNRYRQVAAALVRHGLGFLVGSWGLERFAPFHWSRFRFRRNSHALSRPQAIRKSMEDLGVTFIKLGQILSTRPDLLPPEYCEELSKLQDSAKPVPSEVVKAQVVAELGAPIESVFASFDPTPLASASIGQVHAATLLDGTDVVVKVRRPGVVHQVELDLDILRNLAHNAGRLWHFGGLYNLDELAAEFSGVLRAELDYLNEARNMERIAANFAKDRNVHIPAVYRQGTTSAMLTMDRIRGTKISDTIALDEVGVDRKELAKRATGVFLKMVFEDGFYHADPHPGNLFIEPDGRIALIDFGMVGTLDEELKKDLMDLVFATTTKDADRLVDAVEELGVCRHHLDREGLRRDVGHLLSRYQDQSLSDLAVGTLLRDILTVSRRHHFQLPANMANLMKTVVMAEGIGSRLDPDFNMVGVMQPYLGHLFRLRYSPFRRGRDIANVALDFVSLAAEMPRRLRRILRETERGGLPVKIDTHSLDHLMSRFERITNRLILGIIAAALINGIAVLLTVTGSSRLKGASDTLIVIGLVLVGLLGIWLTWTLMKTGKE